MTWFPSALLLVLLIVDTSLRNMVLLGAKSFGWSLTAWFLSKWELDLAWDAFKLPEWPCSMQWNNCNTVIEHYYFYSFCFIAATWMSTFVWGTQPTKLWSNQNMTFFASSPKSWQNFTLFSSCEMLTKSYIVCRLAFLHLHFLLLIMLIMFGSPVIRLLLFAFSFLLFAMILLVCLLWWWLWWSELGNCDVICRHDVVIDLGQGKALIE